MTKVVAGGATADGSLTRTINMAQGDRRRGTDVKTGIGWILTSSVEKNRVRSHL